MDCAAALNTVLGVIWSCWQKKQFGIYIPYQIVSLGRQFRSGTAKQQLFPCYRPDQSSFITIYTSLSFICFCCAQLVCRPPVLFSIESCTNYTEDQRYSCRLPSILQRTGSTGARFALWLHTNINCRAWIHLSSEQRLYNNWITPSLHTFTGHHFICRLCNSFILSTNETWLQ